MHASYLILHGIENHRPPGHWQFQLAAKLSTLGHQVLYPGLPDPDAPQLEAWRAALLAGLDELDATQERIVVCHSLACLLWLRVAPDLEEARRPDRVMLVAPPAAASLPATGAEFAVTEDELDRDGVIASAKRELILVSSDNDPYNPAGEGHQDFSVPLGLVTSVFPGAGHFTPDDGYGSWPFVSDWCLGHR
ncbi:MAG: alpha/beta hydrolase [Solirubrobacteraceae bacterium]|nr:alpha/beta hydrolase [Solirubrobacteraceae bacterium]